MALRRVVRAAWAAAGAVLLVAAPSAGDTDSDLEAEARTLAAGYVRPAALPEPGYNAANPAKLDLGRRLFTDVRLSAIGEQSCATCHDPARGFEDGKAVSAGALGEAMTLHTPTLWALAGARGFGWLGRKPTLEAAVLAALAAPGEMAADLDDVGDLLRDDPVLAPLAARAFPGETVDADAAVLSLAAFVRALTGGGAAFDAWLAGDAGAITDAQKRGFLVFDGRAGCAACHAGWAFTDHALHDIGLARLGGDDPVRVKTPGLRDIARRAPYFHDGRAQDLNAVLRHYVAGPRPRPGTDARIEPLALSRDDQKDLMAFLAALTEPPRVPTYPASTTEEEPLP